MRDYDLFGARRHQTRSERSILTTTPGPNITRFVNVLAKRPPALPVVPLSLPSDNDWLLKIIAIQDRFVLGLYRREMKAISYLGKIEKLFGVSATMRNWNTIKKVVGLLRQSRRAEPCSSGK
jgi:hypothetical protein